MPTVSVTNAANEITRLLFLGTEWNVESAGGRNGDAEVRARIVGREVPKIWPKATPEHLRAISVRLPVVNYLSDSRATVASQVETLLREQFAPVKLRKAPAPKPTPRKGRKHR